MAYQALLIGGMYFMLCIFIGILLGHTVDAPFKRLTTAITNLADGDYELLKVKKWLYEMSELQNSFDTMAGKLNIREKQDVSYHVTPESGIYC